MLPRFLKSILMVALASLLSARILVRGFSPRLTSGVAAAKSIPRTLSHSMCLISRRQPNLPVLGFQDVNHYNHGRKGEKLFSTKTGDEEPALSSTSQDKEIPMTLLAGFLGSGKTTTLSKLLSNNDGLKIGIIVNDVASVNIDNKLLANPSISSGETIELQNGCACCSLGDEFLLSVQQLTNSGDRDLDAIVVELSGVADPINIKKNWEEALMIDHPATRSVKMDKIVTLVDSSTFGTDWMTWDVSADREGWVDPADSCGAASQRKVPELLAEQVEAADVLVINKIDLAGEEQVRVASALAKSLNDNAKVFQVEFGDIAVKEVLTAEVENTKEEKEVASEVKGDCHSHEHSHGHGDHGEEVSSRSDDCHSHSHDHDHAKSAASSDGHEGHSHSHSHDHDGGEVCNDPDCTDESHSHSHSHSHKDPSELGISSFVYKSDRPFEPTRLLTVLNKWPIPIKDELDLGLLRVAAEEGYNVDGVEEEEMSVFLGVLRSKGFCWMAPTKWAGANDDVWRHNTAMYWSHAGKHFGISTAGRWWGTLTKEQMKSYFTKNEKEYERIINEDFVSEEFGDRRQELVFIGANIDEDQITKTLDKCLCTDEEMDIYRQELKRFEERNTGKPFASH